MLKRILFFIIVVCFSAAAIKAYAIHFTLEKHTDINKYFTSYLDRLLVMMTIALPVFIESLLIAPNKNAYSEDLLPFRNNGIDKLSRTTRLKISWVSNIIILVMFIDFIFAGYAFYNGWEDSAEQAFFMTGVHNGAAFMLIGGTGILLLIYFLATFYSIKNN